MMGKTSGRAISYTLSKLFFPKRVIVDKPGIIINQLNSKYGISKRHRTIYYFEDILSQLQVDTINKIGKKETSDLWYKIGVDLGLQYSVLGGIRKIPKIFHSSVLKYLFDNFSNSGCSVAENFTCSGYAGVVELKGCDNIICRKSGVGEFFSGVVAGLLSVLFDTKYEAEMRCEDCPRGCCIVASPIEKQVSNLGLLDLKNSDEYNLINLSIDVKSQKLKGHSFKDLIKFGKVKIVDKEKHFFYNKTIIPSPIHMFGIIYEHYRLFGIGDILEESVVRNSRKFIEDLGRRDNLEINFNFIKNMLSGFGWGLFNYRIRNNEIIIDVVHAPLNKYGFFYQAYVINGYLNHIYEKNLKLRSNIVSPDGSKITLVYS